MKSRCLEKIEILNSVTVNTGLILALRGNKTVYLKVSTVQGNAYLVEKEN